MSKIEAMRAALSAMAIEALALAGSENEGHKISGHVVTEPVMTEFRKAGVVGPNGGQTRIGALLAGKLIREYEARAF